MLLFAVLCLLITGAPRATANADVHWHALRENTPHVIGALDASDPDGDVLFFRVINATAETRGDNGSEAGATKSLPCVVINNAVVLLFFLPLVAAIVRLSLRRLLPRLQNPRLLTVKTSTLVMHRQGRLL